MARQETLRAATIAVAVALAPHVAMASGFQLLEQSPINQGRAFAGAAARPDDASIMFFNPAGIAFLSGHQTVAGISFIAPVADVRSASASTVTGRTITGGFGGDAADDAFVPVLYGTWQVTPELTLGLSLNAPFGLVTDYDDNWVGRYHGQRSSLKVITATPTAAWRVTDWLAIGAGLQAEYIEAELSSAIDLETATGIPGIDDSFANVDGDDISVGFTAGILAEPIDGTRVGVGFRSSISHTLEGDASFTVPTLFGGSTPLFLQGGSATADLETPETVYIGIDQAITDTISVQASAHWTNWSRFDELKIDFANPSTSDSVTEEDWEDTWFFALGATWQATEALTLTAGVAHDISPIPDNRRTPRIPGADRTWLSIGASYQIDDRWSVAGGYSHIFVDDSAINLADTGTGPNAGRGNLTVQYENSIDIVALQARYKF